MKYVIAAASEAVVNSCQEFMGAREGLEFRSGSVRDTGWDCRAAVVSFPLAHDRYGGRPVIGLAQALANKRADGAPGLILATPPIPLAAVSESPTDAEVQMHVLTSLRACIAAFVDACGDSAEAKILIHLEAAGFDRSDLTPTLSAVVEFLESGG